MEESRKNELFSKMMNTKFSLAEVLFVTDALTEEMARKANITMKQLDLSSTVRSVTMSGAFILDEENFHAALGAVLMYAASKDISQYDVMVAIMFSLMQAMNVLSLLSDGLLDKTEKRVGKEMEIGLEKWLHDHLEVLEVDSFADFKEKLMNFSDCDGKCETCEKNPDNDCADKEDKEDKNLH